MQNEKKIVAEQIINLTDETIRLYDEFTGDIREFPPRSQGAMLQKPIYNDSSHPRLCYVVEPETVLEIRDMGRSLDDIAVISETGIGRDGVGVVYLMLAERNNVAVRFRASVRLRVA